MKKIAAIILIFAFLLSFAIAEDIDLSAYTDSELITLQNRISTELQKRRRAGQAETPASDFIYAGNGTEVHINAYNGDGGDVVIPDMIDGCIVTEIAGYAFKEKGGSVTSLKLPRHLKTIGDWILPSQSDLSGILVLPEELESVGNSAFLWSGITGLVIQSDCEISNNAFAVLNSLEFIYIREGCAPKINGSAFSHSGVLNICIIPSSVTEIEEGAFSGCNFLKIITPAGSYAEEYAKENFISYETDTYDQYVEEYRSKYEEN